MLIRSDIGTAGIRFGIATKQSAVIQSAVCATRREQLIMRTSFHNFAAFEHENLIGVPNCRQPMRDHEAGAAEQQTV